MNMARILNLSFHDDIVRCMSCILIHRKGTIRIGRIFVFPKVTTWLAITFSATCNETASNVESIFDESAFWDFNPLWIHITAYDRLSGRSTLIHRVIQEHILSQDSWHIRVIFILYSEKRSKLSDCWRYNRLLLMTILLDSNPKRIIVKNDDCRKNNDGSYAQRTFMRLIHCSNFNFTLRNRSYDDSKSSTRSWPCEYSICSFYFYSWPYQNFWKIL